MHWLILAICSDFVFLQLFKYSQRQGHAAPVVVATNYLMLASGVLIYLILTGASWPPLAAIITGVVSGTVFWFALWTLNYALGVAPVGAVLTAFRMSIVLPMALGVWIWHEVMSVTQVCALLLTLVALSLMTAGIGQRGRRTTGKTFGLLALVFLLQGLCLTLMRSVHYAGLDPYLLHIIVAAGITGGSVGYGFILFRRIPVPRRSLALGAGIGLYNAISMPVVFIALSHFPGTFYFPITGCSVVVIDNLFAHYFWKERLSRLTVIGVGVAVASLLLMMA